MISDITAKARIKTIKYIIRTIEKDIQQDTNLIRMANAHCQIANYLREQETLTWTLKEE